MQQVGVWVAASETILRPRTQSNASNAIGFGTGENVITQRTPAQKQLAQIKRSESDILSSCLAYLKLRGSFALRMNVGAMKVQNRFVRFGLSGCADILVILPLSATWSSHHVVWVECKSSTGKQSPAQREFQKLVESEGHRYFIVHSAQELSEVLA